MTNEKNYKPVRLECNGATKDFPFDFQVHKNNELVVKLIQRDTKAETTLTENTDYTIKLKKVGGNVALKNAYDETYDIELSRETSFLQKKKFQTSSGFQASEVENSFDRVSCALQDMDYNIEDFKTTFSADITTQLTTNKQALLAQVTSYKADTDAQIEANKQELLGIQDDFEDEVNTKISQVSEAASKINALDEAVNTAITAANTATEKADSAAEEANSAKEEVTKAKEQAQIATSKAEEVSQKVASSLTEIEAKTQDEINKIRQTGFYMQDGKLYYIDDEGNPQEFKQGGAGAGLVAGFLYKPTGAVDESENIFRYANGQICTANDSIKGLLAWINKQKTACPGMFCTEAEWQTAVTLSPFGQCGKYVINYVHEDFVILRCVKNSSTYVYKAVSVGDITQTTTTFTVHNSETGEDTDYTIPRYIIHKGAKLYSTTRPEEEMYIIDENDFHVLEEQKAIDDRTVAGDDCAFTVFLYKDDDGTSYHFDYVELSSNNPFESYFKQISIYDDIIESIRLPKIVNEQGCLDLTDCAITKTESLPNIKGTAKCSGGTAGFDNSTGALKSSGTKTTANAKTSSSFEDMITTLNLDASNYNAIYQDNAHVQQEAIQYPYVICVNTGVEEAERPINNYQVNNVYAYGMSQYYKGAMNNNSWLRSAGQWNSGTVYTGLYNWLLSRKNAGDSDVKAVNYKMTYSAENWSNIEKAFDGNLNTYTTGYYDSSVYIYLDFDTPVIIKGLTIEGINKAGSTGSASGTLALPDYEGTYDLHSIDENTGEATLLGSVVKEEGAQNTSYKLSLKCDNTEVTKLRLTCLRVPGDNSCLRPSRINEIQVDVVDTAISDYDWVLDTSNQTFRLPIKNGQEGVFASKAKGDGLGLGFSNGKSENGRGLVWSTSTPDHFLARASAYGLPAGTVTSAGGDDWTSGDVIGITLDPEKSGIAIDLTVPEGFNLYYYVGDTLQNVDMINIARITDDVSTAKTDALNAKTELDTYKANQVTYETDWFDISPSGVYAFTLTGEKIAQCDYSKLSVQLVCKVKTATGSFAVGDIVYPTFANYNGNSSAKELGTTVCFSGDVLTLVFGNDTNIVVGTGAANNPYTLPKANAQCKVILKGEI